MSTTKSKYLKNDIYHGLLKCFTKSPVVNISDSDKFVVFSDLHMGNGRKNDDFLPNSELFHGILEKYYLHNGYSLILNGDIEELQRYSLKSITSFWEKSYEIFLRFHKHEALFKLFGNHDYELSLKNKQPFDIPVLESLRFSFEGNNILIFHGHQASYFTNNMRRPIQMGLRYFATPLGIKNRSVAHDSKRRYVVEKRIYEFAKHNKIMTIIGHTHRPLFESLSKVDTLKYKIEQICRLYPEANHEKKQKLEIQITRYGDELKRLYAKKNGNGNGQNLYDNEPLVPCVFNSGCVIGKRGITAIEIQGGSVQLVFWFDLIKSQKYLDFIGYIPRNLSGTHFFRVVLKKDSLRYLFSRIKLLS